MTAASTALVEARIDDAVGVAAQHSRIRVYSWTLLVPVVGGVALFGAVYPWAYTPILVVVAGIGAYGWWTSRSPHRQPARPVLQALALVFVVVAVQLIPLPPALRGSLSPHTDDVVRQYDVGARVAGGEWRPISIAPAETLRGLAMFGCLVVFFGGATALVPRVRVKWLTRRLTALGLGIAIFGIAQRATFNGRIYWVWTPVNVASNAFGPFVNRNHFAGWMLMIGLLCAA